MRDNVIYHFVGHKKEILISDKKLESTFLLSQSVMVLLWIIPYAPHHTILIIITFLVHSCFVVSYKNSGPISFSNRQSEQPSGVNFSLYSLFFCLAYSFAEKTIVFSQHLTTIYLNEVSAPDNILCKYFLP